VIVTCPNCGLKQERDQLFCGRCGMKLVESGGIPTTHFDPKKPGGVPSGILPTSSLPGEAPTSGTASAVLNLHIVRSGQILPIGNEGEFIVGRVSEGQSILPDIDLEPFSAYESGVSRLHARIRIEESAVWVTDLGSANGTRINNESCEPHQDYKLADRDMLRLGKLSIQAIVAKD
jgi:hypothetical protein